MGDYEKSQSDKRQMLRSVVEGTRVAHVWTSPLEKYSGTEMKVKYAWPHIEVGPDEHGITDANFVEAVKLEYAGTLSTERAAEKLADMQVAHSTLENTLQ